MQWIHDYDLFLFDFDGLLVNTENLHYRAYKEMCRLHGLELDWTFQQYAEVAHVDPHGLRNEIYKKFPALAEEFPRWDELYKQKTQAYLDLLSQDLVELMPGADEFLHEIAKRHKKSCVVTNSRREMVEKIADRHPALQLIDYWITREDYDRPKPDPECYIKAVRDYSAEGGRAIGFEDSPRGLQALLGSDAVSILITEIDYPDMSVITKDRAKRFSSFLDLLSLAELP